MMNRFRHIRFSTSDYYCRYLDICIDNQCSNNICNGKFGDFLKNRLDIKRLPYGLNLIDLVLEGNIKCDLFVQIPNEYFYNWNDYPFLGNFTDNGNDNETLKAASYYHLEINFDFEDEISLNDLGHPYDSSLKQQFVDRFTIPIPSEIEKHPHPNGHYFYPYECYFAYWKGFILLEAMEECKFIDRYLAIEDGVEKFKNSIKKKDEVWISKYGATFDRLSQYKTITTQITCSNKKVNCTLGDVSTHVLNLTNSVLSDLELDMELLLTLYDDWSWKYHKNEGLHSFKRALILLKKDIYFLFEWLCGCGYQEKELIDKWSSQNLLSRSQMSLTDILDFEDVAFLNVFEKVVPIYSKNIDWITPDSVSETYRRLEQHDCFAPWIRAFYDLHQDINSREEIEFTQPRVLDNLLIISIRTEILLRSICEAVCNQPIDLLKNVFKKLSDVIYDQKFKCVFLAVSSKNNWNLTELREKPDNILERIDACRVGRQWNKEQKYLFRSILYFVTFRNYFAHHYYKDKALNSHVNELCTKLLISCLHTILYTDRILQINNSQENNGQNQS